MRRQGPQPKRDEYLYGLNSVAEALRAGRREFHELLAVASTSNRRIQTILAAAEHKAIRISYLNAQQMALRLGTEHHQGIGARVGPYPLVELPDLVTRFETQPLHPFVVLLDGVQDPHNLGAVVRSALAAGADGVIIPKDRAASPSPGASRASAGALEHVRLCRVTNIVRAVQTLQQAGLWVYALEATACQTIFQTELTGPIAVVIGGEDKGVRPLVMDASDGSISIPQAGPVASLNASAAAAICLFEIVRQRTVS